MSLTPREIGTLVVVILKAQHLPNKQRIGKQDPYCSVALNGEKKRTRAIKRGGQHPEWDEEVRFTLFEDTEDVLARLASESSSGSLGSEGGSGTLPPLPPKETRKKKKVKGGNSMIVACYADDPKEPELIGETVVDLAEVLSKGETDEWFTLTNKDKFSGEVYLELTFWSNEKPPEKKGKSRLVKASMHYGGPGSFVPSDSDASFSSADSRSSIPQSLRTASSLAHLTLYNPPYEQTIRSQGTGVTLNQIADEFGGLSVSHGSGGRRQSFPPRNAHTPQPTDSIYSTFSSTSSLHSNGDISEGYDSSHDPTTPVPRAPHQRHSFGEQGQPFPVYQSPYESDVVQPSGYSQQRARAASSVYPVPSSSSGFVPVSTASSWTTFPPAAGSMPSWSTFTPTQGGTPAPSGFLPYGAQAPIHTGYPPHPSQQTPVQNEYGLPQTQTPVPSGFVPPSSSMGYHQPLAPSQTNPGYQQYPQSTSAPPMMYPPGPGSAFPVPPGPPSTLPTPPHSAPAQQYSNAPSPSHSNIITQQHPTYPPSTPSPPQQYHSAPAQGIGSRPLPMPGQKNGAQSVTPPPAPMMTSQYGASPTHPGGQTAYSITPPRRQQSHPLPTPPGRPSHLPASSTGPPPGVQQNGFVPPPPPPPLSRLPGPPPAPPVQVYHQQNGSDASGGRGNSPVRPPLPQPPAGGSANGSMLPSGPPPMPIASGFQPPPPPPPLPARRTVSSPLHPLPQPPGLPPPMPQWSVKPGEIFNPGPPPRPPTQMVYEGNSMFWNLPQSQY